MSTRSFLLSMTAIAVLSDALLHPFYPHYFARVFAVHDSAQVGFYIGASSLCVLLAFPLWALLARRVAVLRLLVFTQLAAGVLSFACSRAESLVGFCSLSFGMLLLKASYLLIYPYVMSLEDKREHIATIGLLAFVVHFAGILSAFLSGSVLQLLDPRWLFVIMGCADLLQAALCWQRARRAADSVLGLAGELERPRSALPSGLLLRLGAVMSTVYFSAYLSEPFFANYWETLSHDRSELLSGAVFAVPGIAALVACWFNSTAGARPHSSAYHGIGPAIALGVCGLLLQLAAQPALVLAGRCVYGWGLFQAMVRLDRLLFELSERDSYATDFSKANLFQGLGVLFASTSSGALVRSLGLKMPILAGAAGMLCGGLLYLALFRRELRRAAGVFPPATIDKGRVIT